MFSMLKRPVNLQGRGKKVNKSSKMVSLFLSTALVIGGTSGCTPTEQKVVYDKDGNPIVQQDNRSQGFFSGFFGPFGPLGPFGFFSGRSLGSSSGAVRNPGVSSGGSGVSGVSPNSADVDGSGTTNSKSGITGVSPWGRSGSTSTSGGSSSVGGTGITSGSHGGIGGGGSSAS